MATYTVTMEGFDKALSRYGSEMESLLIECARIAINETARWIVSKNGAVRRDMEGNVAFPTGYLDSGDRLKVQRFASKDRLDASIYARFEPTSLARFALDAGSKAGVMVNVKRGNSPKLIKRGWIAGLNKGQVAKGNRGLIVRSEGEPRGSYKPKKLRQPNLWLVYGPSVYQVFRQSMSRIEPMVQERLEQNFDRILEVKLKRGSK